MVRILRAKLPEAYVPQEFPPGAFGQFDWGEAYVSLTGKVKKVQLFCMRLTHSRKFFVKAFPHQKQEALLQGHVDAFTYFGAVPKTITYDNLKTAVIVDEVGYVPLSPRQGPSCSSSNLLPGMNEAAPL